MTSPRSRRWCRSCLVERANWRMPCARPVRRRCKMVVGLTFKLLKLSVVTILEDHFTSDYAPPLASDTICLTCPHEVVPVFPGTNVCSDHDGKDGLFGYFDSKGPGVNGWTPPRSCEGTAEGCVAYAGPAVKSKYEAEVVHVVVTDEGVADNGMFGVCSYHDFDHHVVNAPDLDGHSSEPAHKKR